MKIVSVSELKAHLSKYLQQVRRGGEIQICDRGMPVARLVGLGEAAAGDDAARRERLARMGILKLGTGDASFILGQKPIHAPSANVLGALLEDREDRF